MIIDRKKLFRALQAFNLDNDIKTKNKLLSYSVVKLRNRMNQIISNEQDEHKIYCLRIYSNMILTFYYYYKLKKKYNY